VYICQPRWLRIVFDQPEPMHFVTLLLGYIYCQLSIYTTMRPEYDSFQAHRGHDYKHVTLPHRHTVTPNTATRPHAPHASHCHTPHFHTATYATPSHPTLPHDHIRHMHHTVTPPHCHTATYVTLSHPTLPHHHMRHMHPTVTPIHCHTTIYASPPYTPH